MYLETKILSTRELLKKHRRKNKEWNLTNIVLCSSTAELPGTGCVRHVDNGISK
jgi:hypothetical protein